MGPSPFWSGGWSIAWTMNGSRYAAVLPLPVVAIPIASRPDSTTGNACAWIAVGAAYPRRFTAPRSSRVRPSVFEELERARDVEARRAHAELGAL